MYGSGSRKSKASSFSRYLGAEGLYSSYKLHTNKLHKSK